MPDRFSCFIIGEGTLPVQCANILASSGHAVCGLISPDPPLKDWAQQQHLPHCTPGDGPTLLAFLGQRPFDYLFSIVNYIALPEAPDLPRYWDAHYAAYHIDQAAYTAMRRLPRRLAIHYHDALLPSYAGFHATSWAIMQGESTHGVTWHLLSDQIDAGDIVKQAAIDIAPDETALTLNAKCYAAAITSFDELVQDLADGQLSARPQDLQQRTYFPFYQQPPAGGVIAWQQSAQAIDAFVRALHFGPYANPLGLPKLALRSAAPPGVLAFAIVSRLKVLDRPSTAPPGTLTHVDDDALVVSTTTQPVALSLLTIDGQALPLPEAVSRFGLRPGYRFEELDPALAAQLDAASRLARKHETFWVDRLAALRPASLPMAGTPPQAPEQSRPFASMPLTLPSELLSQPGRQVWKPALQGALRQPASACPTSVPHSPHHPCEGSEPSQGLEPASQPPTREPADLVLAAFVAYVARLNGSGRFDIGLATPVIPPPAGGTEGGEKPASSPLEPSSFVLLRPSSLVDLHAFFASYVPLRVDIDLAWPFEQVCQAVLDQLESTRQHATYARDVIPRYPQLASTTGRLGEGDWPVAVAQSETTPGGSFVLIVPPHTSGQACRWVYDPALFDPDSLERMRDQFTNLLRAAAADSRRPLASLPLLGEAEQHRLVVEWNETQVDFPQDACLHHLFEAQVERTPDAEAVVLDPSGASLSYQELEQRANHLAHHLQRLGVGPDVLVSVCMERSLEMVVGLLGILKAGGAYIPLDPSYPPERLAFMLQDAAQASGSAPVLLTQSHLLASLPRLDSHREPDVICLDTGWEAGESERPASQVKPDHLAYVLYTSGSTGQPKGVMISQRAICNHMHWMHSTFPLNGTDAVLQKTPISFDASVWEFYAPLMAGARLVLAQPGGHKDSAYLVEAIARQRVTTLQLVPSLLRLLLQEPGLETCRSLKRVFCGGEALPAELVARFHACLPEADLYNLYGPTEATIDATFWASPRQAGLRVIPIGRPVANMQAYILDAYTQPVPIGVPGELHLGGVDLARGYLKRPDLTAAAFIPNPFTPGRRLYKTGDLARYWPDGTIEFLGRLDSQVKLRGFRIELGEIESALRELPAVRDTAVVIRQDSPGHESGRLVAYLVFQPQQPAPSSSELRHQLSHKLPDYMIPSAFVQLEALPMTPNGKVDRRALPAPGRTRPGLEQAMVAPRTPPEKALADIWSEVLGIAPLGIHDDFFELGGDSLLATRIVSRVRDAFQASLPLRSLFEAPTIAQLALAIEEILLKEIEQLSEEEVQRLL